MTRTDPIISDIEAMLHEGFKIVLHPPTVNNGGWVVASAEHTDGRLTPLCGGENLMHAFDTLRDVPQLTEDEWVAYHDAQAETGEDEDAVDE